MKAIYKKELRGYFQGIIGWLFLFFFLLLTGIYVYVDNILGGYPYFEVVLDPMAMIFAFIVPMITMRLMAEEKKQKTDQLLLTSGVPVEKIIGGKLLAALTLFGIALAACCLIPLVLSMYGNVNYATAYSSILAFFLMGSTYIAIGTFVSCTTEHQILAAIITYGAIFFTMLAPGIGGVFETDSKTAYVVFAILGIVLISVIYMLMKNTLITVIFAVITEGPLICVKLIKPSLLEGRVADLFSAFGISSKQSDFINGVFNLSTVIYYLSIAALFYFLSVQAVKKRRWN
jgi:ABC-2 type transport system permease protein